MTGQVIAVTAEEIDALHGVGPLAFQAYMLLRTWMDYGTGITGRSRPISLAMLRAYCETHTPRGAGVQITAPSEKEIRTALARLQRAGLLYRLPGDRLAFRLPLAAVACARPGQTGHGADAQRSTEPDTTNTVQIKAKGRERGAGRATPEHANPAHIMNHVSLSSTCALVEYLHNQDVQTAGREETISRWKANGVNLPELQRAVAAARNLRVKAASTQPLNVGLLDRILSTPRPSPVHSDQDLIARGAALGCPPRPGESWTQYRTRLAQHAPPHSAQGGAA